MEEPDVQRSACSFVKVAVSMERIVRPRCIDKLVVQLIDLTNELLHLGSVQR